MARGTIDRWIRAYRAGGFEALAPVSRTGEPVTEKRLLDLAEALKREVPRRTAAQVAQIIRTVEGSGPSARTLQRHFARLGLNTRPDGSPPEAFGRFEAAAAGDLWTGDALHGPTIAGRKTYLFAFIDDHSRALVGYRWGLSEDTVRLEAAFRVALASLWCAPRACYVDNGSAYTPNNFSGHAPASACAWCTSPRTARRPRENRDESSRRCASSSSSRWRPDRRRDLAGLNRLFSAWVETVYHRRVHTETGEAPIDRLLTAGPPTLPTPAALHEAFLWSETRTVTKTATISLARQHLRGRRRAGRVTHRSRLRPLRHGDRRDSIPGPPDGCRRPRLDRPPFPPPGPPRRGAATAPTGIDYLGLLAQRRDAELAESIINYTQLSLIDEPPAHDDDDDEEIQL